MQHFPLLSTWNVILACLTLLLLFCVGCCVGTQICTQWASFVQSAPKCSDWTIFHRNSFMKICSAVLHNKCRDEQKSSFNKHSTRKSTYILTYLLTPCSRVFLEKLTGFQLVKKFPTFYRTWRFITTFTSAHHLSLSWGSLIQSILPHPISWRSSLILSSHLHMSLPNGLFPSGLTTKTLYMPLLAPIHATCPTHVILLDVMCQNTHINKVKCSW